MRLRPRPKNVTLAEVESYLQARLVDLHNLAPPGHRWVFLACCTYIELCASLAKNGPAGKADFKKLCKDYLFPVRPEYTNATYPKTTLVFKHQLYHILRCGVTHTFSMTPDPHHQSAQFNPTPRSVVLAHRSSQIPHLQYVEWWGGKEAYVLIAEDFVSDLSDMTDALLKAARRRDADGQTLRNNMKARFRSNPPLGSVSFSPW